MRSWRDKCDGVTVPVKDYVRNLRLNLLDLKCMACFWRGERYVLQGDDNESKAEICGYWN